MLEGNRRRRHRCNLGSGSAVADIAADRGAAAALGIPPRRRTRATVEVTSPARIRPRPMKASSAQYGQLCAQVGLAQAPLAKSASSSAPSTLPSLRIRPRPSLRPHPAAGLGANPDLPRIVPRQQRNSWADDRAMIGP